MPEPAVSDRSETGLPRTLGAIAAGLVFVVLVSALAQLVIMAMGAMPPPREALTEPGQNMTALTLRFIAAVFAGALTARLAPGMRLAHALGLAAMLIAAVGVEAILRGAQIPDWRLLAEGALALPAVLLGAAAVAAVRGRG